MLGRNVAAELDKNTGKNVTDFGSGLKCHTVPKTILILGQNVTFLGGHTIHSL
jgi:hypothetical protein